MSTWNRVTKSPASMVSRLRLRCFIGQGVLGDQGLSLHYVRFTLNSSAALTVDANKLFALDDFSFSDDQTLNIGSQSRRRRRGQGHVRPCLLLAA